MTYKHVTATYSGKEIKVEFSAVCELPDMTPKDITMESVEVCGLQCVLRDLPYSLRGALHDLSNGLEFK